MFSDRVKQVSMRAQLASDRPCVWHDRVCGMAENNDEMTALVLHDRVRLCTQEQIKTKQNKEKQVTEKDTTHQPL